MPANAGTQFPRKRLASRLRGNDVMTHSQTPFENFVRQSLAYGR